MSRKLFPIDCTKRFQVKRELAEYLMNHEYPTPGVYGSIQEIMTKACVEVREKENEEFKRLFPTDEDVFEAIESGVTLVVRTPMTWMQQVDRTEFVLFEEVYWAYSFDPWMIEDDIGSDSHELWR
jgi:hypothetical protein